MFIGGPVTKCLEIEKYSDTSQKQAVFFRNPFESIPSTVVKARIDWNRDFDDISELKNNIETSAREYLKAIKESKLNSSNLYIGKSEDMMYDPIGTIKDIALFFDFKIKENHGLTNEQVYEYIKHQMSNTEKTRVDRHGETVVETLMSKHDGHLPREKIAQRVLMDNLIQELDSDVVQECYNEYISIISTNAKEGQRWAS
ncbi:MAG: hypothetical protein AN484_00740 [Aphanizomenon flos-aquae WA102]|uniref:Sulfotransferase domain-containing protein n=1 Tax=Aphanizomenon flos-aquae WA102 TaxID=1710896 RepID=A0A1B7X848_APHFL|nr:MAG: hypothetical protein AN484_00740 [Aphanizomenon flos-aquae WA102]